MAKNIEDYKVNGCDCESVPFNESANEDGKEECQTKAPIKEYRSFLHEILHNDATRFKTLLSVCAASGFCILGWTKGQFGPAFLDILLICSTSLEEGSLFMTSYFIGRVMGSILGGAIYSRLNRYLILVVAMTTNSLMFAVIPWCTVYEMMIAAHVLHGISGGVMSVSLISIAASIWGTSARGRVYMNIFYAAYAIFGFLSPIVTSPFLIPTTTDVTIYNASLNVSNEMFDDVNGNGSYIQSVPKLNATHTESPESRLYIAFSISAGFAFLVTIPFVVLFFKSPQQSENKVRIDELRFIGDLPILIKILQFVNVGIFSAVFVAMNYSFSGFLTVFCVQHL
ncbi:sodium-dependent glucose transporter 1-like [Mizuhopecten yessoensis]|uniref:Sodium-dependent glucose transporter 1 n=1 Tax=Mizuhopecten yessoensis TaxID=6573 RepID=A0A210PW42_MIZYE|nr:sodium-dependent glucose transporter 1-like [Mizuhopecten yessoensis]OWF40703.1 Sodium-dependent glucose transporter 1 [Mizuhopecten yessoensis]